MDSPDTHTYYRGYAIQTLVYKHPAAVRPGERTYDAAVRICLESDPISSGKIYTVPHVSPFSDFGDARRAAIEYAHGIINEIFKRAAASLRRDIRENQEMTTAPFL